MNIILIYPHQLFKKNSLIKKNSIVWIIEHPHFFTKYKFNDNKLVYHRATMKFYYDYVKTMYKPKKISYVEFENYPNVKKKLYLCECTTYDPIENELIKELKKYKKINVYETPLFLSSIEELKEYNSENKSFVMHNFYVWQRKKLDMFVIKDNEPYYQKWSFDENNRKKFPSDYTESIETHNNKYIKEACNYFNVDINELHHWLPITFKEVDKFFKDFIKKKLNKFGDYEDAISKNILVGNHSLISSVLNIGMITPKEIIIKLKKLEDKKDFRKIYNSIEGFTRQIIGWREYMRYIYIFEYDNLVTNKLSHKRRIHNFKNFVSNIQIVDDVLKKVYTNGWTHHIERLMVLGNYFFLCEVHPDDVYRFFYENVCLDAYDWVMVGNVYGMSQFASNTKIASKPYFCSSNYLLKMSDYKKEDWCYTIDCLFYRFIKTHYKLIKSNYSTAVMASMYDKNPNKDKMVKFANAYLKNHFK